jgi:hypothetical protein
MVKWMVIFSCILLLVCPVSAYLDPGVGSMVWQMVVVVALGVSFAVRAYWMKIKKFFRREKTDRDPED